eukprot:1393057-Amorphochlora_amoeboformis.AAC.1
MFCAALHVLLPNSTRVVPRQPQFGGYTLPSDPLRATPSVRPPPCEGRRQRESRRDTVDYVVLGRKRDVTTWQL